MEYMLCNVTVGAALFTPISFFVWSVVSQEVRQQINHDKRKPNVLGAFAKT